MVRERNTTVDYALRRKHLLQQVSCGLISPAEVCDATSHLYNAAHFHGETISQRCPICRRSQLRVVHYVFGEKLGNAAGSARSRLELQILADQHPEFEVFAVEVCRECSWNHVISQFSLGQNVQDFKVTESVGSLVPATGTTVAKADESAPADVNNNNVSASGSEQTTLNRSAPQAEHSVRAATWMV